MLRPLLENERGLAVHFIENYEVECTALMEHLLKSSSDIFVLEKREIFCDKEIYGLFFIKNNYTIFHCLPFLKKIDFKNSNFNSNKIENFEFEKIKKSLNDFFQTRKIFCVYGEALGTNFINSILKSQNKKIKTSVEYILMQNDFSKNLHFFESENFCNEKIQAEDFTNSNQIQNQIQIEKILKPQNFFIKKCKIQDLESLVELQKNYRKEEVIIDGRDEPAFVVKHFLKEILETQIVFACYKKSENQKVFEIQNVEKQQNEIAISKAGTNAKGKKYFQIGGVYCDQKFRNKKITFCVMQKLLENIKSQGKYANLFVRVHNESAKKLYKNLGFRECGKFEISYFQK